MKKLVLFTFLACNLISFAQKSPKLVVGIVVDQMRYDYLYRFKSKFQEDGFIRLMEEGANCRNTHYNYVPTYTAPGHASIYTGATPSAHGIVGNSWYNRGLGRKVSNVGDSSVHNLLTPNASGRSPKNLKIESFTDALKLSNSKAKVYSVSIKDRGAILPGGRSADAAFWFDYAKGDFTSSDYYMQELPKWLQNFNASSRVEEYMNGSWDTFYPVESYTESRRDTAYYESPFPGNESASFPHRLDVLKGSNRYNYFTMTPFANAYLADLAMQTIIHENLGSDEVCDFLALSFSSPDIIGHAFGPYSKEIEDCYLRLDMDIARILNFLDKEIGIGNYTLFLTADHAVAPIPQYLQEQKLDAGFFYEDVFLKDLSAFSKQEFGEDLILTETNNNIYLNRKRIEALGLSEDNVAKRFAQIIKRNTAIQSVFTANQLMYDVQVGTEIQQKVARGYDYHRSGDLVYVLQANYLAKHSESSSKNGTTHGSPYSYDSHVPLLFFGNGIESLEYLKRVEITDICPTICTLLELQFPNGNQGEVIDEVLKK